MRLACYRQCGLPGLDTGHVAAVVAFTYLAQQPIRLLIGGAEIAKERVAPCPAPFWSEQNDDGATAVSNGKKAVRLTIPPGSGNEVRCFPTWYAQRD